MDRIAFVRGGGEDVIATWYGVDGWVRIGNQSRPNGEWRFAPASLGIRALPTYHGVDTILVEGQQLPTQAALRLWIETHLGERLHDATGEG